MLDENYLEELKDQVAELKQNKNSVLNTSGHGKFKEDKHRPRTFST